MASYIVPSIILLPFVGFYMIANGEYAISVGVPGFYNGVEVPYAVFCVCFMSSFWLVKKKTLNLVECCYSYPARPQFLTAVSVYVILVNCLILLSFLFYWGGINFFIGELDRGEFRSKLSGGLIYYWLMKIIAPGLFAYYTLTYLRCPIRLRRRSMLWANFVVMILIGAATGFKSTFLTLLLPAILIFYSRISLLSYVFFALVIMASLYSVYFFVVGDTGGKELIDVFMQRMFIAQSDVSWYVWSLYLNEEKFPNYFQSLLSVLGSKFVFFVAGVDRSNMDEWIYYDYNSLLMVIAGLPVWVVEEGHNIIGTIFAEAVIAQGLAGVVIFPLLSGAFVGFVINKGQESIRSGKFRLGAAIITYFSIFILPGLWGGGITTFFHLSTPVGFMALYLLLGAITLLSNHSYLTRRGSKCGAPKMVN